MSWRPTPTSLLYNANKLVDTTQLELAVSKSSELFFSGKLGVKLRSKTCPLSLSLRGEDNDNNIKFAVIPVRLSMHECNSDSAIK